MTIRYGNNIITWAYNGWITLQHNISYHITFTFYHFDISLLSLLGYERHFNILLHTTISSSQSHFTIMTMTWLDNIIIGWYHIHIAIKLSPHYFIDLLCFELGLDSCYMDGLKDTIGGEFIIALAFTFTIYLFICRCTCWYRWLRFIYLLSSGV